MSQFAVHLLRTFDDTGVDVAARDEEFRQRVVPGVKALPGFVHGTWSRFADGLRSTVTVVFGDRAQAEGLIDSIRDNLPNSHAAGVHLHSIEAQEVFALA